MNIKSIDQQLKNQPTEVKFCTKCVFSNQRPRLLFNENGVCGACQFAYKKHHLIDWEKREKELQDLCNHYRSKNGEFDVIVPVSGGKDSSYTAHLLKTKYNMHPLCVTWAPFIYTDIGWKNFNNFIQSGFEIVSYYQNGPLHQKLARLSFELNGDHWQPFGFGQKTYPFYVALKFKIPLIFYGENGEAEYGGSLENADKPFESPTDWEKLYYKGVGIDKLVDAGIENNLIKKDEINRPQLDVYRFPDLNEVKKLDVQMHWLSYYHKWVPQENFYYAQKYTGFEANPDGRSEGTYSKYASLDDKTDGFHFYLAFIKFGLGRATSDAAHEIRDGHITREEGVALVNRYDGEFPKKYFPDLLKYLNISEEHFWKVVNRYRPSHLWKRVGEEWQLLHKVK